MKYTFKKDERIKKRKEFDEIFAKGKKFYCANNEFMLVVLEKEGIRKLGISISRKIKKAVSRNRIKRISREIFRLNKNNLKENIEIVLVVRKNLDDYSYVGIYQKIKQLFILAKIYKNEICE
ncbi:MAG: ribonuclease P protein component [bacterium]